MTFPRTLTAVGVLLAGLAVPLSIWLELREGGDERDSNPPPPPAISAFSSADHRVPPSSSGTHSGKLFSSSGEARTPSRSDGAPLASFVSSSRAAAASRHRSPSAVRRSPASAARGRESGFHVPESLLQAKMNAAVPSPSPAALIDIDDPALASAEAQERVAAIASDFAGNLAAPGLDPSSPEYRGLWESEAWIAEQRFRAAFGSRAWLRHRQALSAAETPIRDSN